MIWHQNNHLPRIWRLFIVKICFNTFSSFHILFKLCLKQRKWSLADNCFLKQRETFPQERTHILSNNKTQGKRKELIGRSYSNGRQRFTTLSFAVTQISPATYKFYKTFSQWKSIISKISKESFIISSPLNAKQGICLVKIKFRGCMFSVKITLIFMNMNHIWTDSWCFFACLY